MASIGLDFLPFKKFAASVPGIRWVLQEREKEKRRGGENSAGEGEERRPLFAGVLGNKRDTLLDVLLEVAKGGLKELLFIGVDLADG